MVNIAVFVCTIILFIHYYKDSDGSINCSMGKDHTLCKYKGPAKGCVRGKMENDHRNEVVTAHNKLRSRIVLGKETLGDPGPQPPAANMLKMSYDEKLAKVAQRWAEQCTGGHDTNRKDNRFPNNAVGQNAFQRFSSAGIENPTFSEAVQAWYGEVKDFPSSSVDALQFQSATGHYSQVVWAETWAVGCGYATTSDKQKLFIVCNYGPAGNCNGKPVYAKGEKCSKCPTGHTTCENGLCT